MNMLFTIEDLLSEERIRSNLTPFSVEKASGISRQTILRIERHENYTVKYLLAYVNYLNLKLLINGIHCKTLENLGEVLKRLRTRQGETLMTMAMKTKMEVSQILKIEKGRGYTKEILCRYIQVFPVNIDVQ